MNLRAMFSRQRDPDVAATGPVLRSSRGEWRSLPPLQRLAPTTTTIDAEFDRQLATADAPSFLDELGHLVDPDGPGGRTTSLTATPIDRPAAPEPRVDAGASPRRIDFGRREPGRVTAPPPTPTLSRAPAPPVQRHLAADDPVRDAPVSDDVEPHAAEPVEKVRSDPASDADPLPDVGASPDPAWDGDPLHDVGASPDPASDADPLPDVGASPDPAAQVSVPTVGARPLIADDVSGPSETVGTTADAVDFPSVDTSDGSVAVPKRDRVVEPPASRTPSAASVQRRTEPGAATVAGASYGRHIDPLVSPADPMAQRSTVTPRGAEIASTGSADVGHDDPGGAGDVVAPVLSRSGLPFGQRPRLGSPLDVTSLPGSSDQPTAQRSQPPHRGPAPAESARADSRRAPPPVPMPAPHDATGRSSRDHAARPVEDLPIIGPSGEATGSMPEPSPAPTIQPLLGVDAPVVSRVVVPEGPSVALSDVETPARARPASSPGATTTDPSSVAPTTRPATRPVEQSLQRMAQPAEAHRTVSAASADRSDPIAQRRTLGLDGWTPRPAADGSSARWAPTSRDGERGDDGLVTSPESVQRATFEAGEHPVSRPVRPGVVGGRTAGPPAPSRAATVSRSMSASAPAASSEPARSAPVEVPTSILSAIGHASEITPLGQAALEESTVTWTDDPDVQRHAMTEGSASKFQPTELHAEAAWLPAELQRDSDDAPRDAAIADTLGAADAGATDSVLAGASEADVIGLMRTMYPHLRRRLTRDLLLDRERIGHRTDIRY